MAVIWGLEYPIAQAGGVSVLAKTLVENLAQDYEIILVSPDQPEALRADPIWPLLKQHLPYNPHDASAQAALLALTRGSTGIYNVADDDGTVSIAKARKELGFDPAFRLPA